MVFGQRTYWIYVLIPILLISLVRCHDSIDGIPEPDVDLTIIPYYPIPFVPAIPADFPALEQPLDNPMTVAGIALGRKLFFDPIFSIDSTISCSSCHRPEKSFTDGLARSIGVDGTTRRGSMSLINVGFHYHGLFWDGRSASLEAQVLLPIEDPIEMGESWENVERKLKRHPTYPADFRKAFGMKKASEINRFFAAKAIAQFERSIISGTNSKFDRFRRGEIFLEENETNGFLMFFDKGQPDFPDAECAHCHNAPLLATNDYFNNGIQASPDFLGFEDIGLGFVTGVLSDNGRMKAPTLRNIAFTAPYMHDGRFETLEEVIDHYNSGGHYSPNKSAFLYPLKLTESQKSDLLAFLMTLSDSTVLTNPSFQSPF